MFAYPKRYRNPEPGEWGEEWTRVRLATKSRAYKTGIARLLDSIKTILSFTLATSFIGVSLVRTNDDDSNFIRLSIWFGYMSFLISVLGIVFVTGASMVQADILDDLSQLDDMQNFEPNLELEERELMDRRKALVFSLNPKRYYVFVVAWISILLTPFSLSLLITSLLLVVQVKIGRTSENDGLSISIVIMGGGIGVLTILFVIVPHLFLRICRASPVIPRDPFDYHHDQQRIPRPGAQ